MPKLCVLDELSIDISVLLPAEYRSRKRIQDSQAAFDRLNFGSEGQDFAGMADYCRMVDSCSYSKGYNQINDRDILKILVRYNIKIFAIPPFSSPVRVYLSAALTAGDLERCGNQENPGKIRLSDGATGG